MERKWTPGPWEWDGTVWDYDKEIEAPWLISRRDENGKLRSVSKPVIKGMVEVSESDANLIAAAPELYEALEALMPVLRMAQERVGDVVPAEAASAYGTLMAAAETALSKARGEATT